MKIKISKSPATMGTLIRGDLPKGCLVYDVSFAVGKVPVVTGFFVVGVVVVVEVLVEVLVVGFLVVDGALDVVVVVVEITIGVQHSPRTDSPIEVQVWPHDEQQTFACFVQQREQ